jgi:hypothetical protein
MPAINTTAATLPSLIRGDFALAGTYCSDNQAHTENFKVFVPALEKL